jgi:negative regulator of sigma-B (phosphoserine phosphatase)
VETIKVPLLEYGVAKFVLPGHDESGDLHLVRCTRNGILIAAIDGLGHGEQAAEAAKGAMAILRADFDAPVISLVEHCHEKLRKTRGVVLSLASIDPDQGMMTWLGVGNVQGLLMRANGAKGPPKEMLLQRGGVVGSQLPALQATVLPIARGDTLYFATDGIRNQFSEHLTTLENPQRAADRILEQFQSGFDDALVLVARLAGVRP